MTLVRREEGTLYHYSRFPASTITDMSRNEFVFIYMKRKTILKVEKNIRENKRNMARNLEGDLLR